MSGIFKGFKDFIARGNAIEMAVGIVIGAAFSNVINTIVDALINPIIGFFLGSSSLSTFGVIELPTLPWAEENEAASISVGGIADAILNFLLIAVAVYLFIVLPMNKLAERRAAKVGAEDAPAEVPADEALLAEIRDLLKAQNDKP